MIAPSGQFIPIRHLIKSQRRSIGPERRMPLRGVSEGRPMDRLTVPLVAVFAILFSLTVANTGMRLFQASLTSCVQAGC